MKKDPLFNEQAREKISEMVEGIRFGILESNLGSVPTHAVPMATKKVDEQGVIWFISHSDSEHNAHIQQDNRVQLMYADPGSRDFLVLYGTATITKDHETLKDLYDRKTDATWFDGPSDPHLTAISVKPEEGHYWDSDDNRLVNLFKMGKAALTGDKENLGKSGDLRP